jgi:hypothetical protein
LRVSSVGRESAQTNKSENLEKTLFPDPGSAIPVSHPRTEQSFRESWPGKGGFFIGDQLRRPSHFVGYVP